MTCNGTWQTESGHAATHKKRRRYGRYKHFLLPISGLMALGVYAQAVGRNAWNLQIIGVSGGTTEFKASSADTESCSTAIESQDDSTGGNLYSPSISYNRLPSQTSIWNSTIASDYSKMLDLVYYHRREMEEMLSSDDHYGVYFREMFYSPTNKSRGMLAAQDASHPEGWASMVQRLQLKLLESQEQELRRQQATMARISPHQSWFKNNVTSPKNPATCQGPNNSSHTVPWILAVSGHSSSAGHGNFDDQSYASVLEQTISPLFSSVGIYVETRNYGMSGKPSAPEVALCLEAFFGVDPDVLLWDTAQTDHQPWFLEFWMQRAAIHPNNPILMVAHATENRRIAQHNVLERIWGQHGPYLPLVVVNDTIVQDLEGQVPNTLSSTNVSLVPDLLKYLKCTAEDDSQFLEANEPCKSEKFDLSECTRRKWMVPWHPGYRRLALYGTLLALLHADALHEAVQNLLEMAEMEQSDGRETPRRALETQETSTPVSLEVVQRLRTKLLSLQSQKKTKLEMARKRNPGMGRIDWANLYPGVDPDWLFQSPSVCRTARLPSQQRYKGVSTGNAVLYRGHIPVEGIEHSTIVKRADKQRNSSTTTENIVVDLEIGYDDQARWVQQRCKRKIQLDFSDYFYVTDGEWRRAILPSSGEEAEYGRAYNTSRPYHGIIIFCPLRCNKQTRMCYGDELLGNWSRLEFQVNGVEAFAEDTFISEDCGILSHKEESMLEPSKFIFPPRISASSIVDRTWEVKIRIKSDLDNDADPAKLFQINSIVLL